MYNIKKVGPTLTTRIVLKEFIKLVRTWEGERVVGVVVQGQVPTDQVQNLKIEWKLLKWSSFLKLQRLISYCI